MPRVLEQVMLCVHSSPKNCLFYYSSEAWWNLSGLQPTSVTDVHPRESCLTSLCPSFLTQHVITTLNMAQCFGEDYGR